MASNSASSAVTPLPLPWPLLPLLELFPFPLLLDWPGALLDGLSVSLELLPLQIGPFVLQPV